LHYLENAIAIDTKEVRFLRTQGADPAAYLAIRFWLSSGVKVDLNDSRDPTPYWLITTRKATQLVQALKG